MSRIREITAADVAACVEILEHAGNDSIPGESAAGAIEILRSSPGRGIIYVVEQDGDIAGLTGFDPDPIFARGGVLWFVVIRDGLRGRGIGRQLVGFVERKVFGRAQGLYLTVSRTNESAMRFFKKLGYSEVGDIRDVLSEGPSDCILWKSGDPPPRKHALARP